MSKRTIVFLLSLVLVLSVTSLAGCQSQTGQASTGDDDTITVVATLFPPYDFAKVVGGDRVTVTKLMPAGVDSHSFEPSPSQVVEIGNSDLLLYTGDLLEPWVSQVAASVGDEVNVVDTSAGIPLRKVDESDHEEHENLEAYDHDYDPHVWTDPNLAMMMVDTIADALASVDPEGDAYYHANAAAYKEELTAVDASFQELVDNAKRKEMIFGDRFALLYFTERYGLEYMAAIDSCSTHTEPSAKQVALLIDETKSEQIPVIYYEELTEPTIANRIAEATGAKALLFHTCHNVSKQDMDDGVTYLSLMEQNAVNLREGLY